MHFLKMTQTLAPGYSFARVLSKSDCMNANMAKFRWCSIIVGTLERSKGVVDRNQYIFGLPAEILGSRRKIQGNHGLPAPDNSKTWKAP